MARDAGPAGVAWFGAAYVVATVVGLPASALTLGAGAIWGPLGGTLAVWPPAVVGATAAFFLARTALRDVVAARVAGSPRLTALDAALGDDGLRLVTLLRLSPLFPFNLLNYGLGATRVSARDYVLATAFGILPGTAMYVGIGATLGDVAAVAGGAGDAGPAGLALRVVGLAATVAVTVLITRRARAALDAHLPPEGA